MFWRLRLFGRKRHRSKNQNLSNEQTGVSFIVQVLTSHEIAISICLQNTRSFNHAWKRRPESFTHDWFENRYKKNTLVFLKPTFLRRIQELELFNVRATAQGIGSPPFSWSLHRELQPRYWSLESSEAHRLELEESGASWFLKNHRVLLRSFGINEARLMFITSCC